MKKVTVSLAQTVLNLKSDQLINDAQISCLKGGGQTDPPPFIKEE